MSHLQLQGFHVIINSLYCKTQTSQQITNTNLIVKLHSGPSAVTRSWLRSTSDSGQILFLKCRVMYNIKSKNLWWHYNQMFYLIILVSSFSSSVWPSTFTVMNSSVPVQLRFLYHKLLYIYKSSCYGYSGKNWVTVIIQGNLKWNLMYRMYRGNWNPEDPWIRLRDPADSAGPLMMYGGNSDNTKTDIIKLSRGMRVSTRKGEG